jgi:hypothetical protein
VSKLQFIRKSLAYFIDSRKVKQDGFEATVNSPYQQSRVETVG